MKITALFSILLISVLIMATHVNCDEAADLKVENQKFIEAKNILTEIIARMKSDYIKNFASILAKGVVDLEERTQNELKTENNSTKRYEIIRFATKAYERLVKFIKEIEEHFPSSE